uniref:Replicase large subunit n=1 Tax=Rhizopus microsporus virga-like virus 1 TaxID=3156536 RepID=A0AAT9H7A6_9VIRU
MSFRDIRTAGMSYGETISKFQRFIEEKRVGESSNFVEGKSRFLDYQETNVIDDNRVLYNDCVLQDVKRGYSGRYSGLYGKLTNDVRKRLRIPQNIGMSYYETKKPMVVVPFIPMEEVRRIVVSMFNDYDIVFRNYESSANEIYDAMMTVMMQHARNLIHTDRQTVLEVAGDVNVLMMKSRLRRNNLEEEAMGNVVDVGPVAHCCYDKSDVRHLQIYTKMLRRMSGKDVTFYGDVKYREDLTKIPFDKSAVCFDPLHCSVKVETLVINHMLVDYSLQDVANLMYKHEASVGVGVVLFTPDMLRTDRGVFPNMGATFDIDRKKDTLVIRFVGDRLRSRSFTFSKYLTFVTATVVGVKDKALYIERVESNRGCMFMYRAQIFSVAEVMTKRVPKHRVWYNISDKAYLLRLMKPKYYGCDTSSINNYEWREIVVNRRFYDEAYSYVLNLEASLFKMSNIRKYVNGKAARHIVNLKEVSVNYDFTIEDQDDIALFLFMTAYIERYNLSKTVSELIRRTNLKRNIGKATTTALIWYSMWSQCSEFLYDENVYGVKSKAENSGVIKRSFDYISESVTSFFKVGKSFSKLPLTLIEETSIKFEKTNPKLFEEYATSIETTFVERFIDSVYKWLTPIVFDGKETRIHPKMGPIQSNVVPDFTARADLQDKKKFASILDSIVARALKDKKQIDVFEERYDEFSDTTLKLCKTCIIAFDECTNKCPQNFNCGCDCGAKNHVLSFSRVNVKNNFMDLAKDDIKELPEDLLNTCDIIFDNDGFDELVSTTVCSDNSAPFSVIVDPKDVCRDSKVPLTYIYDPDHMFPTEEDVRQHLAVAGELKVLRDRVTSKGRKKTLKKNSRLYIFQTKDSTFIQEELLYFSVPRDVRIVCFTHSRSELSDAAKTILEKLSVMRVMKDEDEIFVRYQNPHAPPSTDICKVPLATVADPLYILQEQYDKAVPGVSTQTYVHDNHIIAKGDVDVQVPVSRMELHLNQWSVDEVNGATSALRTAQGCLNTQKVYLILSSLLKRNLAPEYQCTPQNLEHTCVEIISTVFDSIGHKNWRKSFKEFQEEGLDAIPISAFETYVNKQPLEKQERIAKGSLDDEDINYINHFIMNKDTTKPKLDNSIFHETPVVQTIVYNDQTNNATISPQIEVITQRLMSVLRPECALFMQKSIPELEEHIGKCIYSGIATPTWVDLDGSKFDKSHQEFALLVEMTLYKLLGFTGFDYEKWSDSTDYKKMVSYRAQMRIWLARQRSSGNRNTALGNSIVMLCAVFSRLRLAYEQILCVVNLGDDITIATHGRVDTEGFDDAVAGVMNISVKCTVSHQGYILGHYIVQRGDQVKLMYDIYRKLESLGRMDKMEPDKLKETFISFKDNVATLDDETWIPLFQEAVKVYKPHLAKTDALLICRAMKTLSVSFEDYVSIYNEYKKHTF